MTSPNTDRWVGGTGSWTTGAWISGAPPTTGERVVDNSAGTLTLDAGSPPEFLTSILNFGADTTIDLNSPVYLTGHLKTTAGTTVLSSLVTAEHAYVGAGGFMVMDGGTLSVTSGVDVNGGIVDGSGLIAGRIFDNGSVLSDAGGTLSVGGNVTGDGVLGMFGANSSLYVAGNIASTVGLDFGGAGQNQTLTMASGSTIGATISDFYQGDTIVLQGETLSSSSFNSTNDILTLVLATGQTEQLQFGSGYTMLDAVQQSDNIVITDACFLAGTRIATPDGERAIETLAVGDLVLTQSGQARAVKWLGFGSTIVSEQTPDLTPVVVRQGAIAENVPSRDLYLTRHHAILVQGRLVPVNLLVNHRSICFDARPRAIEYYHVELDTPDILMTEGLTTESYREDGKTMLFQNAWERAEPISFVPAPAPYAKAGPELNRIWRALSDRAGRVDQSSLTREPDLHLTVDGVRLDGGAVGELVVRFVVDTKAGMVRIRSRSSVPAELGTANDKRRLGVAIQKIVLRKEGRVTVIGYDDPRLSDGFHVAGHNHEQRWTNGDAVLPTALFEGLRGKVRVEIHVAPTTLRYRPAGDGAQFGKMVPDRKRATLIKAA